MPAKLLVIGGGFAGLWAAAAAARLRDLAGAEDRLDIALVAPDPFHTVRVRCYETDLAGVRVPLDDVLGPIGVERIAGRAERIDPAGRTVSVREDGAEARALACDRLVLATGSALSWPPVPGLAEHGFDVDTYDGAARLARHLGTLAARPKPGRWSAVVVGAGLVGIEIACELPARLRAAREAAGDTSDPVRVLLLERGGEVAAEMGAGRPAILAALAAAGVELRTGASLAAVDGSGGRLGNGERIAAATFVGATGMRASALAADLDVPLDRLGRVPVDAYLAAQGIEGVYAAGDVAAARADAAGHVTVMSCQHARPMGRIAGHNAACDLLGLAVERVAFAAPDYVTCLDLGASGAVYTGGWDRSALLAEGAAAKRVKTTINRERIYPPLNGDRSAILAAAAPVVQARPALDRAGT